ncbi:response regulator transcription factor [Dethiobacter alkaliphilus]|uniref:response regulator transcription factor n=1 Tax=Dethiobacter alkaliphilus TaxID=427926 RepID=UPI0022279C4E|nr:response regulator transcription factor [Dethiobacter alkaliphilus]
MNGLQQKDSAKVLSFLNAVNAVDAELFREQVMLSFAKLFGYKKTTFWLTDKLGNLHEPMILNIKEEFIEDYEYQGFKSDFLHPRKVGLDMIIKNKVLYIQNFLSNEEFKKTEYCEFLGKYDLFQELGIYFIENNKLIGAMALLKSQREKAFSAKEVNILKFISKHISKTLNTNLLLQQKEYLNSLLGSFCNNSSTGLIIIDRFFNIHYSNTEANEICKQLSIGGSVNYFVKNVLSELSSEWKQGLIKNVTSEIGITYTLHIIPGSFHKITSKSRSLYLVYITPNTEIKQIVSVKQDNEYDLTIREREVLDQLIKGYTNQEIASELFISISTVKKHVHNIFNKMNVTSRASLCYKLISTNSSNQP